SALSEISGILSRVQAAVACDLGQERSFLYSSGGRSISKRLAQREDPISRYGSFRNRDTRCGNCDGDEKLPRRQRHLNGVRSESAGFESPPCLSVSYIPDGLPFHCGSWLVTDSWRTATPNSSTTPRLSFRFSRPCASRMRTSWHGQRY